MFSTSASVNNNASAANNGQFPDLYQQDAEDQYEDGSSANVPLYEGDIRPEWRYTCACCFGPSGLTPTYRQSLSAFLVHLIEEHADGESLDLIARVTLAQYPPLRCGPSKGTRGSSRQSSVHGGSVQGSVRGGSVQGSVQGSFHGSAHGSVRGASINGRGAPALNRANLNSRSSMPVPVTRHTRAPQPPVPAPVVNTTATNNTAQIYQQMLAQNQALMAQMQALGLHNMDSVGTDVEAEF